MAPVPRPARQVSASAPPARPATALALLQQYLPRLRAFVRSRLPADLRRREAASDVVQSVCREMIQRQDRFQYQGEAEFRGWLFTAALYKVHEKLRYHHRDQRDVRREEAPASDFDQVDSSNGVSADYSALAHERVAVLEAALDRLSRTDREIIAVARLAGLPMDQVAVALGKTEVAARRQLGRALLRLADELHRASASSGPATADAPERRSC